MRRRRLHIGRLLLLILGFAIIVVGGVIATRLVLNHMNEADNEEVIISNEDTSEDDDDSSTSGYLGVVVLDAGHGGSDPGCVNGIYQEKDITLAYALEIGAYLEEHNVYVVYTRTDDTTLETESYTYQGETVTNDLRARAELGEEYDADLFVSIHVDSLDNMQEASGFSIYVHNDYEDSIDLGEKIASRMNALNYTTNNGIKDGSALRVIRLNTTISCLIELGYITGDLEYLIDSDNREALSAAIAKGIIDKLEAGMIDPDLVLEKQPNLED